MMVEDSRRPLKCGSDPLNIFCTRAFSGTTQVARTFPAPNLVPALAAGLFARPTQTMRVNFGVTLLCPLRPGTLQQASRHSQIRRRSH